MFQDFIFTTLNADFIIYVIFFTLVIAISVFGFVFILLIMKKLKKLDNGSPEMQKIHNIIKLGSKAYLKRQYKTIGLVLAIIFIILLSIDLIIIFSSGQMSVIGISFLVGAISSIGASYISMIASTMANVKVTQACKESIREALKIGFDSGLIIGITVISASLLGISILYIIYNFSIANILGFGFGSSFAALFAQLGGGIFTKGADIGADIVGKLEERLPEDDYRNPAVIADMVGDNVGDCAGRGADLFESSSANNLGAMVIGVSLSYLTNNPLFIIFSLISRALGLLAAIIGSYFVKMKREDTEPIKAFTRGLTATSIFCVIFFFILTLLSFGDVWWLLFICSVFGICLGISTYFIVAFYTSSQYRPVKEIIKSSETGAATNVISGFAVGLESTMIPIITYVVAIIFCYILGYHYGLLTGLNPTLGGVFGITVATLGLLAITTIILAFDGFGPISDNAAGIAEMSHLGEEVRRNLDRLDSVGNTTKALAKGFGMTCAALSAIVLFEAYLEQAKLLDINIYNPVIMISLFIGAALPFFFSSLAIRSTGIAAYAMIKEIKNQFTKDPGILAGTSSPNYVNCIDIATKVSLKQMIFPSLITIATPLLLGFLFGAASIAAFLISGTISGILLGFVMNTGGGALDNAKKAIEGGIFGGKGSTAHSAAVVGDTFGDPLKDTAGPSLHIFIKVINTISITFVPLFLIFGGLITL